MMRPAMAAQMLADIAKNQALALPTMRAIEQRRHRTRTARQQGAEYARATYGYLRRDLSPHHPLTGTLLEVGPGTDLGVCALFAGDGMDEAVAIDIVPWQQPDPQIYRDLGVEDVLERVRYMAPVTIDDTPFEDASFDVVISYSCFEHFLKPSAAVREIARLLKPGGITGHVIDMRNHRNFAEPLDHLRYPEWLWRLMVSRRPFATNRWRLYNYIEAFDQVGLRVVEARVTEKAEVSEHVRQQLQPEWRCRDRTDLEPVVAWIAARKDT